MRILIIGATEEAWDLVKDLVDKGHEIIVLDDDKTRIDKITRELDIATYIFSSSDLTPLLQAGVQRADVVLAMHPLDTINMLACTFAKHYGVPKIFAVVSSTQVADILKRLNLVDNTLIKSRIITKAVTELIYDVKLVELDDKSYLVVLRVEEGSYLEGKTIGDIEGEDIKVLTIFSGNDIVKHDERYVLKRDDKILIVVKKDKLEHILVKH